jgi:hypothetical protein
MASQIESLKAWSHFLFWVAVSFPLIATLAGVARYYVDRREKSLSSQLAKAELEQTKKELAELKTQTAPRRLTEEQKSAMATILAKAPPATITFVTRLMDSEGAGYAQDFGRIFTNAKWTVHYNQSSLNHFSGVSLAFVDVEQPPIETSTIFDTLMAAGIAPVQRDIKPSSVSGLTHAGVAVFIGAR